MVKNIIRKAQTIDYIFIYKAFFLVYTIFTATEISKFKIFSLLKFIIFVVGATIIAYQIYATRGKYLIRNKMLFLFTIFNTLTLVANAGKIENFKFYLITLIQVILLTTIEESKNVEMIKDDFNKLNILFICTTAVCTAIGILIYLSGVKNHLFSITDISRNDLIKGIYVISTSAGLLCYLSIAITLVTISTNLKLIKKNRVLFILGLLNIIIQFYGLSLSGARGSLVALAVFIVMFIFLLIPQRKLRMFLLALFFIAIICFPIYKSQLLKIEFLNKNPNESFFSGRMILWENSYKYTFKEYKFLGTGAGMLVPTTEKLANIYLPGIDGGRVHNIYLDVLCSNGIIGFSVFVIFIISLIIELYISSFSEKISKENRIYIKAIFAIIASILVINLVESIMLYVISISATVFWIYFGYSKNIIENYKKSLLI